VGDNDVVERTIYKAEFVNARQPENLVRVAKSLNIQAGSGMINENIGINNIARPSRSHKLYVIPVLRSRRRGSH